MSNSEWFERQRKREAARREELDKAYTHGYQQGYKRSGTSCPYYAGTEEREEWMKGYAYGDKAQEEKNKEQLKNQQTLRAQGYLAGRSKFPGFERPYTFGTEADVQWQAGYVQGRQDYFKATQEDTTIEAESAERTVQDEFERRLRIAVANGVLTIAGDEV